MLTTNQSYATYLGNGGTTLFPFGFITASASQLVVSITNNTVNPPVTTVLSPSQYTATGFSLETGGSVSYPVSGNPLPAGWSITIQRIVPYQQSTSLTNQGAFYPQVVEACLDNLTMQTQQLAAQISGAAPVVLSSGTSLFSTPELFGAKGDGATDDAAAVDAAVAFLAGSGGGTLILRNTYALGTFSSRVGGSSSFIVPESNVNIVGQGPGTGFMVKQGMSPAAWNVIFSTNYVQNAIYKNFQINGGVNVNGATARTNAGIGSTAGGYNVLVDNVTFTNMPGDDTVYFGYQSGNPLGFITVQNCRFLGGGSGIAGNTCADHDDIYLNGNYCKVLNNFSQSSNHVTGTFAELHGDFGEIAGNTVYGFNNPCILCKLSTEGNTNLTEMWVHGNKFYNCYAGGVVFSNDTTAGTFGRVHVYDNVFTIGAGAAAAGFTVVVYGPYSAAATMVLDEHDIHDNVFINYDVNTLNLFIPILTKDVRFRNNKVYGFNYGVQLTSNLVDGVYANYNVSIQGNLFDSMTAYAVYSAVATRVKSLIVSGNTMNTGTAAAIYLASTPDSGYVGDNLIDSSNIYPVGVGAGMANVAFNQVDPAGKRYVAYSSANAVYGLLYEVYGTASPAYYAAPGCRMWNTGVTASTMPGWICTAVGTPGTWAAMASPSLTAKAIGSVTLSGTGSGTATIPAGCTYAFGNDTTSATAVECIISGTTLYITGGNNHVIQYVCF